MIYRYYLFKNDNRHFVQYKNMLPLVEGVMVDYHTQKTNITLDLSRVIFVSSCGNIIYYYTLN